MGGASTYGNTINASYQTIGIELEDASISEEVVRQVMPDIVEYRNQALTQLQSSIVAGCFVQSVSTLLGMTAGWYQVQPPSPIKVEVRDVFPVIAGGLWGAGIGFALALLIINRKLKELKDGWH